MDDHEIDDELEPERTSIEVLGPGPDANSAAPRKCAIGLAEAIHLW